MSEVKQTIQFNGSGIDYDSALSFVVSGDGRTRRNILISEDGENGRITNMKGNEAVTVAVNNEDYVGSFYNPDTRYVYWLGHDASTTTNTLVKYNVDTKVATVIFEDGSNYFGIDPTHKMKDWDMIGDMLFFNPQTSEPKMINVVMAENYTTYSAWSAASTYVNGNTIRYYGGVYTANTSCAVAESPTTNPEKWDRIGDSYDNANDQFDIAFNVIKKPPTAPTFVYGSDNDPDALTTTENPIESREINNLRGKLFKFASRFIYYDDTRSVYSALSSITLPIDDEQYDGEILEDLTTNNKLILTVDLGHAALVKYVEIIFQQVDEDWKLMTTIDRQNPTNLNQNTTTYDFYNDKAYDAVENALVDIIYDVVPKTANCQEIINKNILCYGEVTEGFNNLDKFDLDVTLSTDKVAIETIYDEGALLRDNVASGDIREEIVDGESGREYYSVIDLSGYGGWGLNAGDIFQISVNGFNGVRELSAQDVSSDAYILGAVANTITDSSVWAQMVIGDVELWVGSYYGTPNISICKFYTPAATSSVSGKYNSFKTGAVHPFCIFYYDEALRRGDAQVSEDMQIYVPLLNELSVSDLNYRNKIDWSVNHTPPTWAKYWRWGYAGNSLCSYFVRYVITDVDDTDESFNDKTTIDITPLQTVKIDTPNQNTFYNSIIDPYVWQQGDRVRILTKSADPDAVSTLGAPVTGVYDYEITGYDETTYKLIIQSTTIKADLGVGENTLVEIYRPLLAGEKTVYYEFGPLMPVTGGYHTGITQSQTASLPATGTFNSGDVYVISRTPSKPLSTPLASTSAYHESAWWSDFYLSEEWSKGKLGYESTIGEKTLNWIRYSNQYLQDTKVNGFSTFSALDFKELTNLYGEIKFMVESGDTLKVYQTIKSCSIPIGRTEYTDAEGNTTILKSTEILGATRYSFTNYGTVYPTSVTQNNRYVYGFDIYNGIVWRDSANGLFPISGRYESADAGGDYKMQAYFKEKAKALLTSGISNTSVQSVYDEEYKLLYFVFTDTVTPANNEVIAYHEPSNRWVSFYDFTAPVNDDYPCWLQSLGMSFLSFIPTQGDYTTTEAEGVSIYGVWRHNSDSVSRCKFYGEAKSCVVGIVANQNGGETKVLDSIEIQSNKFWSVVVEIEEDVNYPYGMYSIIPTARFKKREGLLMSEFMRNGYTTSGTLKTLDYVNGEELRGRAAKITLTNNDTSKAWLLLVNVNMSNSKV